MDLKPFSPQHFPALAAALLPLAGWGTHAAVLRRRLDRARRDPLTGLLTREGFTTAAARLLHRPDTGVLVLDLDQFKQINDTHGHAAGDAVLADAARVLTEWAGEHGITARLGGDEFAVARPLPAAWTAVRMGQLAGEFARPVAWHGRALHYGASVGLARVADLPDRALDTALGAADAAMYRAKRAGGGWQQHIPGTDLATADRRWRRTRAAA
ncbi:GGDEF domain-containing protein [Kitasatospora purpeofusca]|uniref:GGDEF domain-containing protein n=1 Tax=Kitasatospora purpeofusca TaxID=67352 RepID=UPI002257CAFF|nr:GGDEF domain-containing protein [Kitasatospora purpeofusca]MCX4754287.1 GGDEF domain-containing protein [Kitasatospora purpeofusca]WSR33719.1 GGDEF domain-containing protein [Kitasatospora purpeofusca]